MSEHPVGSCGSSGSGGSGSGSGPPTAAPSADAQVLEPAVGLDAALLLLHAAGKGDAALVGTLCELGVDPNATHPMMEPAGAAPLHMAAQTAGGDAVIRALAAAAGSALNLNPRNCSGETPLMYAACYGHAANVHALLELGSETEAADECGRTALMMAASAGHGECTINQMKWGDGLSQFGALVPCGVQGAAMGPSEFVRSRPLHTACIRAGVDSPCSHAMCACP